MCKNGVLLTTKGRNVGIIVSKKFDTYIYKKIIVDWGEENAQLLLVGKRIPMFSTLDKI